MNFTRTFAALRIQFAMAALASVLAFSGSSSAFVLPQTQKVLFLGNSITYHPPYPDRGWYGNWGMAASALDKDYVHVLLSEIAGVKGSMPASMVTTIVAFEQDYKNYNINTTLQAELAFGADVVVVAIGENVPYLVTTQGGDERPAFGNAFRNLLSAFKAHGNPTIFVRSSVWPQCVLADQVMQQVTAADGDFFVNISAMQSDPTNYATGLYADPGVAAHPCDKGMKYIADSLFGSMVAHSTPEPGTLALLTVGLIGMGMYAWRKRRVSW
jgi:hypothetical protein